MYGLEPREFRASYHAFVERLHRDDRKRVELLLGQALKDGRPFDFEHRIVRPDGTVRTLHAVGAVERSSDGQPMRMFGTARDITAEQS
jgi:PAS domain S-box-containing protein